MKRCSICGQHKEITEFYSGYAKCKSCYIAETNLRAKGEYLPQRWCSRCEETKAAEHFPVIKKTLRNWCFDCDAPKTLKWCIHCKSYKDKTGFKKYAGQKCGDCLKTYEKTRSLARYHGMTLEDYQVAVERQENSCWICGGEGNLVVDHNHNEDNGGFRALLCHSCNRGLGFFQDDPKLLLKAQEYLNVFGHYGQEAVQ